MKTPLLWIALVAGCAGTAAQVREMTYPTGFRYLSEADIRGPMGRMAHSVGALDELLRADQPPTDEAGREQVVALLESIDLEAAKLDDAALGNHPELAPMPAFRQDVALALRGARAEPPNYFAAGLVAQSCLRCHTAR